MPSMLVTLIAICLGLLGAPAQAHQLGQSYIFLDLNDTIIRGRFEVTTKDLNAAFERQFDSQSILQREDLEARIDEIRRYLSTRISFAPDGKPTTFRYTDYDILSVDFAQFVVLGFELEPLTQRPQSINVDYEVLFDVLPSHRGLVVVENDWRSGTLNEESNVLLSFSPQQTNRDLVFSEASVLNGLATMIELGTHHIWIGIDHILFLIALLLPCVVVRENATWKPVEAFKPAIVKLIKIVTVFTIAHTITLSYASLSAVHIPARIVESIIALSIGVAALDILMPIFRQRVWLIVFGFGLFHGFGFASVLGELGIPDRYMSYSLLGFNIGVELGQLVIVMAVFPLLYWLRQWPGYIRWVMPVGASMLIAVALYWFTERAFEIDLPAGSIISSLIEKIL